jgi:hypothetical protein
MGVPIVGCELTWDAVTTPAATPATVVLRSGACANWSYDAFGLRPIQLAGLATLVPPHESPHLPVHAQMT